MKIYFRLIQFCRPLAKRVIPYGIFTFLQVVFGLLNFTLLIPLLNVLFGQMKKEELAKMLVKPEFSFSTEYVTQSFDYYFATAISEYGQFEALKLVCLIIVVSVTLTNIFRYLSNVELELLKIQTIRNLRNTLFEKVTKLHVGYFSNQRKGDIISKLTNDISVIENTITQSLSVLFKEPATLITYFVLLMSMSTKLTLFTLMVIPVSGLIISFIQKQIKRNSKNSSESYGRLISLLEESLSGIRVMKAFNGEQLFNRKFKSENDYYTSQIRKINLKRELASPFSEFSGVLVVSFILLYGGSLVLSNQSELGASEFVAYIIVFSQILRPAKAISTSFTGLQTGIVSGERVLEMIDLPIDIKDSGKAIAIDDFKEKIVFENVSFNYGERRVLKNLNFEIPKGKMIALVGPSGGGKTTISDLLPRFYDPAEGNILIDGCNLKDVQSYSLRNLMGVVTQESILFNDTIFNNIAFSKTDATEQEVIAAAKIANAHEFIMKSEHGYQTQIGDRGVKLSGGQKQRLCIARAILKNPPIIILDEATSALDTESEKLVQEALDNLMQNRTSLVIAHRLSTIQKADLILVLKDGEIIERGSHSSLVDIENGLYKRLQQMQAV